MVDFKAIKAIATAEKVVAFLGLSVKNESGMLHGRCPICQHSDSRALAITPSKGVFYCFRHKKGGDMLALVSEAKGISIREAAEQLAEECGLTETAPSTSEKKFDPEKYLATLDPAHEALATMDVSAETFKAFKGGYKKGKLWLALEASDGIKGFVGISLEDRSMTFPKDCDPRLFIFGAYRLVIGDVHLLQDPIDVLQATERGIPNCISFFTEKISVSQLFFLSRFLEDRKLENIVLP